MNYKKILDSIVSEFENHLLDTCKESINLLETEDFGWTNIRYTSDIFRLAHFERYSDDKIEVLHITTFPHKWSPEPIFGFDVICTNNKVIGAYMDLSPGITNYDFHKDIDFKERKPVPAWATVFSDKFILLAPETDDEFIKFVNWSSNIYKWYITILMQKNIYHDIHKIIEIQNNYCKVQASNPRTYNVLKTKIGEERAKYFMQKILFPKIYE